MNGCRQVGRGQAGLGLGFDVEVTLHSLVLLCDQRVRYWPLLLIVRLSSRNTEADERV